MGGVRFRRMQGSPAFESVLAGRSDLELGSHRLRRLGRIRHWAPEFEVLVRIISVGPEDLAKAEIRIIVIAERKFFVIRRRKPLVYEHPKLRCLQLGHRSEVFLIVFRRSEYEWLILGSLSFGLLCLKLHPKSLNLSGGLAGGGS